MNNGHQIQEEIWMRMIFGDLKTSPHMLSTVAGQDEELLTTY